MSIACVQQELLRFQTDAFNASLEAYDTHIGILQDEQINYPVDGAVHGDRTEYQFPLERDFSIQRQCEALLRTRVWTMRTEVRDGMLSLEALNDLFPDPDDEWAPLNRSRSDDRTREKVAQALRDYREDDFGTSALYDYRKLALPSRFCEPTQQFDPSTPPEHKVYENIAQEWQELMDSIRLDDYDLDETITLWEFDDDNGDADVGGMHRRCPCAAPSSALFENSLVPQCRIAYDACEALAGKVPALDAACARATQDQPVSYPATAAADVREALRATRLASCATFQPSNLWGFDITVPSLLMHGVSGVTLSNLAHVQEALPKFLGEPDRELALHGVNGTQLANALCTNQAKHDLGRVEAEALPAVHVVAASPVELACMRYVVDAVWARALHDSPEVGVAERLAANRTAALWQQRCDAKIRKLQSCQDLGTYAAGLVQTTAAVDLDVCPFSVQTDTDVAFFAEACLVEVDGKLYDLWCQRPHDDAFVKSQRMSKCLVRDPRALLANNTDTLAAIPGLRYDFVQELAHSPDLYDHLFPEPLARSDIWFAVGSVSPPHSTIIRNTNAEEAVRVAVQDQALTDRVHAQIPGLNAIESSRYAVLDSNTGVYWKPLPVLAPTNTSSAEPVCFDSVPYWPTGWQFPLGEALAERTQDMAGFANYMAVRGDEASPRRLQRPIHASDTASRFYAATGVCREHNVGMPLQDINTHRLCTLDVESKDEACSKSAGVDTGGGLGQTLGPLFQVLRHWLAGGAWNTDYQLTYAEFLRLTDATDHAEGEHDSPSGDILREQCNMFPDRLHRVLRKRRRGTPQCSRNDACNAAQGEVCLPTGECREPIVEVEHRGSQTDHRVEIGFASPGCAASPGTSGASPWERARHLTAQHGLCGHRHTVTYERMMLALGDRNNSRQACTLRSAGGFDYYECDRNHTEWDWVTENPTWWGRRAADLDHGKAQSVYDFSEFDLEPHPCDYDFMHAGDWGFCHTSLAGAAGADDAPSYWMRLAASHDNFTVMRDREDPGQDISTDDCGWNKLRFMGLEQAQLKPNDTESCKQRLGRCQDFGVCENGRFTVGGVLSLRHFLGGEFGNQSEFYEMDNIEKCGPMGRVLSDAAKTCQLDEPVTALFQTVRKHAACQQVLNAGLNREPRVLTCNYPSGPCTYARTDRTQVRLQLNRLFSLHPDYLGDWQVMSKEVHKNLLTCVAAVQNASVQSLGDLRRSYRLPDGRGPGIYLFMEMAAAEVPVFWWLKYALERLLLHGRARVDSAIAGYDAERLQARDVVVEVRGFAGRGTLPVEDKLGVLWTSMNTQYVFDLAAKRQVLFEAVARWLEASLGDKLEFARPQALTVRSRNLLGEAPEQFLRCFETLVYGVTKDGTNTPFAKVCHAASGSEQDVSMSLLEQYRFPVVQENNDHMLRTSHAMFGFQSVLDTHPDVDSILPLLKLLVQNIFDEEFSITDQKDMVDFWNPYTRGDEVLESIDQKHLPVMSFRAPDGKTMRKKWSNGVSAQLRASVEDYLDFLDGELDFKDIYNPPPTNNDPQEECIFQTTDSKSMAHRAYLEFGNGKTWTNAKYTLEDNTEFERNLCHVQTRPDDEAPIVWTIGGQISRGSSCSFFQTPYTSQSKQTFSATSQRKVSHATSQIPSFLTNFCDDAGETCCPDFKAHEKWEQNLETNPYFANNLKIEDDVYFGGYYKKSHAEYTKRREQRRNKRCVRTDTLCFVSDSSLRKKHQFAKEAWHGERSDCEAVRSIQVPKPFHVEASYNRNEHIPLKHWLQNDKILQRQEQAYGGRLVMAVRPTPEGVLNMEHVLPAPEWSYCPDDGDEDIFKMHTFVTEDVPVDPSMSATNTDDDENQNAAEELIEWEKWFANRQYRVTNSPIDGRIDVPRKLHEGNIGSSQHIGRYNWNMYDPIRDLKGPWLQTVAQMFPDADNVNNFEFGGYFISPGSTPFDKREGRTDGKVPLRRFRPVLPKRRSSNDYDIFKNKLHEWKDRDLLCRMPSDAQKGFYDPYILGRCYDDFSYSENAKPTESKPQVTACQMLTEIFDTTKFHHYFSENFLGLDVSTLNEIRMTELFEPLNPQIQSLVMSGVDNTVAWKEIANARFYVNPDGTYSLGDANLADLENLRQISQQALKAYCDYHFSPSSNQYCRYLETSGRGGKKLPFLFQRHLYDTYRFFSEERSNAQNDEQNLDERTNLQLAPCRPLSKYSSLHDSGRLRRSDRPQHRLFDKTFGVENAKENCWSECGKTDGICPQFCTNGVCCRRDPYKNHDYLGSENANYRQADVCYYVDENELDGSYHSCAPLPSPLIAGDKFPQESLLAAADIAMDYLDRDGWCARGGSRRGLDLVPDVWLELNAILQANTPGEKMIFPCPINGDGTDTGDCKHILRRYVKTTTSTDTDETNKYTLDRPTCSFVLNLTQAVCANSLSTAAQQCRDLYDTLANPEVFTRYNEPDQGVAWECRECRSYDVHLPRRFTSQSKIGWGLFFDKNQVFDPSQGTNPDTGFQKLQTKLEDIFTGNNQDSKTITSYLQTTLDNQNQDQLVSFRLQNETSDGADHVVYIALDEAQRQLPLPAPIVHNFREFGQRTPIEDPDDDDDDTEGRCVLVMNQDVIEEGSSSCALQLHFSTRSARLASELLLASLLAGCIANADTPLIEPTVCTPHIVAPTDTRYTRLQTFTDKVLRETFGLKLPTLGHQRNTEVYVHGAHWLEGVLPFYARQRRTAQTRDDQYVQHLFNDEIRCQTMFLAEASLLDMPCFADANATVNLANPWLGGNYSFFRYLTVIEKIDGNFDPRFSAGFDTCALRQTVQGLNLQPCQARTCLSDQFFDEIHPDDVNRTVCKFSRELNKRYLDYEIIDKTIEMAIQAQDNLGEMYRPPLRRSLCDTGYSDASQKQCKHYQAALGFSPLTLRGRAAAAPSLNRTSTRNRVADKISKDILRLGNTSHGASLWSGALYTADFHARTAAHTYAALAVAPEQTGFARLQLEIGANDVYRVRGLGLFPSSDTQVPGVDWLRTAHQGVAADQARVAGNPLYSARRMLRPHWACPLLVREALTFSETLSSRHPETHMLVPDPLQARELFPDLLGAHAALRTRPVLPTELARYRMLGHHRVLPQAHLEQSMSITDARDMVRVLVQNKFEDLDVVVGGTEACLEWPRVHNQTFLRSNEEFTPGEACESAATDLGEVAANATRVRIQANADFDRAAPRGRAQAHACYRAPLLKLSDAEWRDLHDPAWQRCEDVTEGSWDKPFRQVRCIARGSEKVFNFSTTRPGSERRPYEVPQHVCQASTDAPATAETSLAVRQAISPLRARLRRSGLDHYEPETIWMLGWQHWDAIFMRQASESSTAFSGPWLQGPCPGATPIAFAFDDWYDPAMRESKCRAKLDDFANDAACAGRDTQVGLDLCLIAGLRELCDRLREATQHFTTLNAMRAGLVPQERAYYTPSVFVHQDGEFASTAVAATYRELGMQDCRSWTVPDQGYFDRNCGEKTLLNIITQLNRMRQVTLDIVVFLFQIIDFAVYLVLSVGFSLASAISGNADAFLQMQQSVLQNLLQRFLDLLEVLWQATQRIFWNMLWSILQSFLDRIRVWIEVICNIISAIIDFVVNLVSTFDQNAGDDLRAWQANLDVCGFFREHLNWLDEKIFPTLDVSPLGDRCFVLPGISTTLPTGLLGGVAGGLRCGPLSLCKTSELEGSARPCMLCDDGYDCNPFTKMCQCGVQPPPASTCTRTGFCRDQRNDAQCVLSAAGEPDTTAVQACLASTTTSLVACVFATPIDVEGTCMLVQGTARQLVSTAPGEAAPLRLRVPPGIQPGAVVDFMDTALVPTASVIINPRVAVVLQQCNLLARDVTCQVSNAVAGAAGVSGAARRLLAETTSLSGKLPSWNASGFLEALLDTPGSSIQNTTSSQHSTVRKLLQTTADDDDVLAFDFAALGVGFDPTSLDLTNAELPACTNDKSAQVAQFMRRTAQLLAGHGWKQRELCSDEEEKRRQEILRNQPCPWVTSIASGLIDNTQELVQYYTRAREEGGCLNAVNNSCVPPPLVPASNTSSGLWPLFPQHDFAEGSAQRWEPVRLDKVQDTHTELLKVPALRAILKADCESTVRTCVLDSPAVNFSVYRYQYVKADATATVVFVPAARDVTATNASASTRVANTLLVQGSTAIVDFLLSLFDAEPNFYSTLFFNMVSLEATHHDGEFARQKRTGEYSIGRMVREAFECRFDDMIACKQQNNSLILSFCTMFFFILVITLLLPLPSVLSFFLWTLGLTLGTLYRAYGYSPWCVPLVPNCLGHGLYDIAQTFMPPRLTLPRALLNDEVCDETGMRLSGGTGPCLRRCEEHPFFIQSGIDALMHVEGVFNGGEPLGSAWQLVLEASNDTTSMPVVPMPEPWEGWMQAEKAELPVRIESPKWGVVTLREWTLNASARRAIDDTTRYAFAERTWRPVHGLPVTETVVKAGRGLLYEWVGDDVWEDVHKQVGRAAQNGHRGLGNSDFAVATLLCITFFSADVVAAILAVLVGLPIAVYVVQYFVLLNLVVLQIFLDNFLSVSGFDADEAD